MEWLSAHASHDARPGAPKRCGCCEKAAARELWSVGGPALRRSRMRYQSSDNWVMEMGVGIIIHSCSSCRLSHDCDPGGVSAESADIVSDPFDGLVLVEQPDVCRLAGCTRESKNVETVAAMFSWLSLVSFRQCDTDFKDTKTMS